MSNLIEQAVFDVIISSAMEIFGVVLIDAADGSVIGHPSNPFSHDEFLDIE